MSSLILETGTRAIFHSVLIFSLFLLFSGHNAPGGGFIGGLVAAGAFVLFYVAHGPDRLRRLVRVAPESLLGSGLGLAVLAGVGGLLLSGSFLQSVVLDLHLPVLGVLHLSSVLVFDIGVYAIVLGLGLKILETLGGEMSP